LIKLDREWGEQLKGNSRKKKTKKKAAIKELQRSLLTKAAFIGNLHDVTKERKKKGHSTFKRGG